MPEYPEPSAESGGLPGSACRPVYFTREHLDSVRPRALVTGIRSDFEDGEYRARNAIFRTVVTAHHTASANRAACRVVPVGA